jgi:hypothetical protein
MSDQQRQEGSMPAVEPARERIARRLHEAVERLRHDMEQVEFWTEVLGCLTRTAPDYNSDTNVLNRFKLPSQDPNTTDRIGNFSSDRSSDEAEIFPPDRPSNTNRSRH